MLQTSGYPFVSRRYNAFPRNPCKALVAKWIHHQWQHGGILYPTTLAPPQLPLASPLAGHEAHIANLGAIDSDHPISAVGVLEISMRKCTMDRPLLTLYGPHIANI